MRSGSRWAPDAYRDSLVRCATPASLSRKRGRRRIAMTKRGVEDRWRYFCGVAWRKVAKLQEIARRSSRPTLRRPPMARIRTIKPTFWGDAKVNRLSWDARLLLIGLISMADDAGDSSPATAQSPVTCSLTRPSPAKFKRLMREVDATGIVDLYRVDGHQYGRLRRWGSHQKISHPQPSVLPNMPGEEAPE